MTRGGFFAKLNRDCTTRAIRLSSGEASLVAAESIYEDMRIDRPHMAVRLSKLMPKLSDDARHWGNDVVDEHVHIWALKAYTGSKAGYVAIMWFELVEPSFSRKNNIDTMSTSSSSSSVSSSYPLSPLGMTAHVEVLWTHPSCRQYGYGTQLVQSVLVRYPQVSKWTAFTSRDLKKDPGVHKFWMKQGFHQESLEIGKVNQDGFFIRNSAVQTSKRRRVPTKVFQISETS
jgi:GNAT superfamily N-acetyltransferase